MAARCNYDPELRVYTTTSGQAVSAEYVEIQTQGLRIGEQPPADAMRGRRLPGDYEREIESRRPKTLQEQLQIEIDNWLRRVI